MNFSDDSSDDENLNYLIATGILPGIAPTIDAPKLAGSQAGKSGNIKREFGEALRRLNADYFSATPKYGPRHFEGRFRLPVSIFNRIEDAITGSGIFVQREDGLSREGIHPRLRITAALRMLAYGVPADSLDEYLQMSKDSVLLSTKKFCEAVIDKFGEEYLRAPTEEDLQRIMRINAGRGFPGCIGSIDCQHWEWGKCPISWAGQFKGKGKKPTIVLEAIADGELWIWHCFFGVPGSLNDLNVLDHSNTIEEIIEGKYPPKVKFVVNGTVYTLPYYLADGIYPSWALFMKTIAEGSTPQEKLFASAQEAVRKDIERAFGVLVARFHILSRPSRLHYRSDIANVMRACVILHNMVVEHRRDGYESGMASVGLLEDAMALFPGAATFEWQSREAVQTAHGEPVPEGIWAAMVASRESHITSAVDHFALKRDLVAHIWKKHGI